MKMMTMEMVKSVHTFASPILTLFVVEICLFTMLLLSQEV